MNVSIGILLGETRCTNIMAEKATSKMCWFSISVVAHC